eukprot:TRINITY_DN6575_c0_g1_i1.p1 TRINITY_DN6575_c0_g1~~TRINITY_DN6575_c0_g1_i1.p1  ORF type:complete len:590 (+),score=136.11 TRINITY_DN6575_c0_g1_i1:70-1839(+)
MRRLRAGAALALALAVVLALLVPAASAISLTGNTCAAPTVVDAGLLPAAYTFVTATATATTGNSSACAAASPATGKRGAWFLLYTTVAAPISVTQKRSGTGSTGVFYTEVRQGCAASECVVTSTAMTADATVTTFWAWQYGSFSIYTGEVAPRSGEVQEVTIAVESTNDNSVCTAAVVEALPCNMVVNTITATEAAEPDGCPAEAGGSAQGLWYDVEAAEDTDITAHTCTLQTEISTQLSVFATCDPDQAECVAHNTSSAACLYGSAVTWSAHAGTHYYVYVAGSALFKAGHIGLNMVKGTLAANSHCDTAADLGRSLETQVDDNVRRAPLQRDLCHADGIQGMWYRVPPAEGLVTAALQGEGVVLEIYDSCTNGSPAGCSTSSVFARDDAQWQSNGTTPYWLLVRAVSEDSGAFTLTLRVEPPEKSSSASLSASSLPAPSSSSTVPDQSSSTPLPVSSSDAPDTSDSLASSHVWESESLSSTPQPSSTYISTSPTPLSESSGASGSDRGARELQTNVVIGIVCVVLIATFSAVGVLVACVVHRRRKRYSRLQQPELVEVGTELGQDLGMNVYEVPQAELLQRQQGAIN